MESFEVQGHWWLPNQTEPIAGTLRFSPSDGVILDLIGGFGDPFIEAFSGERYTVIHGIDVEGNRYTVFFPLLSRSKIRSGGMVTTAYSSHFVLRGEHYASKDDVRIRKVRCRFWSLDEWVDTSGIRIETTSHSPPSFTIQYSRPQESAIDIDISPRLRLSIEFSLHGPARRVAQTSVSFEQKAWVGLEAVDDSFELDRALDLVGHLQDFLTLGMGEPTYVLECEVVLEDVTDERGWPVRGALFWKQRFRREQRKTLLPFDMFFTWRDLGDNVRAYVENWYAYREPLQKFFDLYFGALYNPGLYIENRFLTFVQALELYHRKMGKDQYVVPPEEFLQLKDVMLNAVPEEHRSWLSEKLKYTHEASLRQRLRELWDDHAEIFDELFGRKGRFIQKVVITRNYLVHNDPLHEEEALSGSDLWRMNRSLSLMLRMLCAMDLMGMSPDRVRVLLNKRGRLLEGLWRADAS